MKRDQITGFIDAIHTCDVLEEDRKTKIVVINDMLRTNIIKNCTARRLDLASRLRMPGNRLTE